MVTPSVSENDAQSLVVRAQNFEIVDSQSCEQANECLTAVITLRREIEANYNPAIEAAHKAHAAMLTAKRKIDGPLAYGQGVFFLASKFGHFAAGFEGSGGFGLWGWSHRGTDAALAYYFNLR